MLLIAAIALGYKLALLLATTLKGVQLPKG